MNAPSSAEPTGPLRFGRFELQPAERVLLAEGRPVPLGGRAYDMLVVLANRAGHLVTKGELLDLVWPRLVVEESNLHTQMSTLRKVLGGDVVATVPGRGYRFTAPVTRPDATDDRAPSPAPVAAPPASAAPAAPAALPDGGGRLFGRDDDLRRLESALAAPGCVTLVGAGGVGKTRLALAAAERWPKRRVWVDLAALRDAAQVPGALARAIGQPGADGKGLPDEVLASLDAAEPLVVLDNAEHLVDAVAGLARHLRQQAPHAHLLVTSQLPLGLAGEQIQRLDPLADGAVDLLSDRIALADHRVALGADTAPLLADICRQLDGLPLAIEMAAARVPMLGLRGVRDALAGRFAVLTTGHRLAAQRHRTLQGALEWSLSLLGAEERHLFAALGVFAGGFSLELAVAMLGETDRWTTIDRLATLVDRSLVAVSADDPPRYRLLETMRAHALQCLAQEPGGDAPWRDRHARVVLDHLRAHAATLATHALCIVELDNVGEAIAWARAADPVTAIALATQASLFTTFTTWRLQAFRWLDACQPLARAAGDTLDPQLRCDYWNHCARSAISNLQDGAPALAREAYELSRRFGDDAARHLAAAGVVRALRTPGPETDAACAELEALAARHPEWEPRRRLMTFGTLAFAAAARGDRERQLAMRLAELQAARETGMADLVDATETNIVAALDALGRHDEALARSRELVGRLRGTRNTNLPWAWDGYVSNLIALGRHDEAAIGLREGIDDCKHFDVPILLWLLATLAQARGRLDDALRLAAYAVEAFDRRRLTRRRDDVDSIARIRAAALARFGAERVEALVEEGRRLDDAEAVRLACGR